MSATELSECLDRMLQVSSKGTEYRENRTTFPVIMKNIPEAMHNVYTGTWKADI
jgi:hypothetical protein